MALPFDYRRSWQWLVIAALGVVFIGVHDAQALVISPLRQTIVIEPGATQIVHISVMNDRAERLVVEPEAVGFGLDPNGRPVFDHHEIGRASCRERV